MLAVPQQQVHLDRRRVSVLDQAAQPGGNETMANTLRHDWGVQDKGLLRASVSVSPWFGPADGNGASVLGLDSFSQVPALTRHTVILEGAGHAAGDLQAQHIVAQSGMAWFNSAQVSIAIGSKIVAAMAAVDAPWHRARPVFDWLTPWAGHVPSERLANRAESPS